MERQRRLFIILSKVCFLRFQPLEFSPCIGEGYSATAKVRDDQYEASPRFRSGSRRLLQFLDGAPHGLMLSLGTVEHSQHLSEFRIGQ